MAYNKLIENIAKAVESKFDEISVRYNFDNGEEFEIALCELLSTILPSKYGVCRGFAVSQDDQFAGDDIIIYDKERFPTIRLLEAGKFDKKHEIPVEAVYAYIEAKHSLIVDDNETNISKALEQVFNIKNLKRAKRNLLTLDHNINLGDAFSVNQSPHWPPHANPFYTAIVSRNIKNKKGEAASFDEFTSFIKKLQTPKNILAFRQT